MERTTDLVFGRLDLVAILGKPTSHQAPSASRAPVT